MPTLEATLTLKQDGKDLAGTPITWRQFVASVEAVDQTVGSAAPFTTYGGLDNVQVLLVRALDELVTVRLDNQSDAGIVLNPGGWLAIVNSTIDAGVATNVKVQQNSGNPAQLQLVFGGEA